MAPEPLSAADVAARLRALGVDLDAGRAERLLPLAASLLGRLGAIREALPRDLAPAPLGPLNRVPPPLGPLDRAPAPPAADAPERSR